MATRGQNEQTNQLVCTAGTFAVSWDNLILRLRTVILDASTIIKPLCDPVSVSNLYL